MIERRPFQELAAEDLGWLKVRRHISSIMLGDSSQGMQSCLQIWNDDEIAPNSGFALHSHANIEIVTYVREGIVTHRFSLDDYGQALEALHDDPTVHKIVKQHLLAFQDHAFGGNAG